MNLKKIIIIGIFFLLTNCDYEPIFSQKNIISITVNEITIEGDKKVNRYILNNLNLIKNDNQESSYNINLNSTKKIDVLAKDSLGNDSIYRTTIKTNLILEKQGKIFKEQLFTSSFSYNNIENKFDLSEYQKSIEADLIDKIAKDINIYLSSQINDNKII